MQTFLVDADFAVSAKFLDNSRLNKQLLEGRQILTALAGESQGWRHHPATLMWAGYEGMLYEYLVAIRWECVARGIETAKNWDAIADMYQKRWQRPLLYPRWYNDERLDRVLITHRASLYRKDPEYYATFNPEAQMVDDDKASMVCCMPTVGPRGGKKKGCDYYWPSHKGNV